MMVRAETEVGTEGATNGFFYSQCRNGCDYLTLELRGFGRAGSTSTGWHRGLSLELWGEAGPGQRAGSAAVLCARVLGSRGHLCSALHGLSLVLFCLGFV